MSGNRSLDEFGEVGSGDAEPDGGSSGATVESESGEGGAVVGPGPGEDDPDSADAERTPDDEAPAADEAVPDDEVPAADEAVPDEDALDPPASTYVWHSDGAPCAACGAAVEERWREGDDLVCADCKAW